MGKLIDKVAVVTGATSGIGTGIVSVFAEEGAKVVFCGRREEKGLAFEAELKQAGYDVTFVKADVTRKEDLQALLDTTLEKYGQVDILVNNAGIMRYYSILDMDIEKDYDQVMNVNLRAYFLSTSLFAKAMKAGGSIINISSVGGKSGSNTCTSYGASKAGVINLTAGSAKELAPLGIRVNAILPGMVYSEIMVAGSPNTEYSINATPLKRGAQPREIGTVAAFLASEEASYITGAQITVDGGMTA